MCSKANSEFNDVYLQIMSEFQTPDYSEHLHVINNSGKYRVHLQYSSFTDLAHNHWAPTLNVRLSPAINNF